MRYHTAPQSIYAVLYDGWHLFMLAIRRLWPVWLPMTLMYIWLQFSFYHFFHASVSQAHLTSVHDGGVGVSGALQTWSYVKANVFSHHQSWHPFVMSLLLYMMTAMSWVWMDFYMQDKEPSWHQVWGVIRARWWVLLLHTVALTVVVWVGMILFMIPALVVYVLFYYARFFICIQGLGVFASFRESAQMVWGTGWWRTFLLFLMISVLVCGWSFATALIHHYMVWFHQPSHLYICFILTAIISAILEMLYAAWQLVMFHDLRLRWVL